MAYFALLSRSFTGSLSKAEWAVQVVDQEKLVLLFINYMFFSVIVMTFILFLMCLTQTTSIALDAYTMILVLAVCFIMVNLMVADYLVKTMSINKEIRLVF